ncbi:MAG: hypothetical protein ACYTHJ_14840 [Planctomycetota bacterium]
MPGKLPRVYLGKPPEQKFRWQGRGAAVSRSIAGSLSPVANAI